jgi:hypothetical protein
MIQTLIALAAAVALIVMGLRANARFRSEARLPMQWSLTGEVVWTAPRRFALALTPTLSIAALAATVVSTIALEPRPGQEGYEVPIILLVALVFIGAYALHLRLIDKTLTRKRS